MCPEGNVATPAEAQGCCARRDHRDHLHAELRRGREPRGTCAHAGGSHGTAATAMATSAVIADVNMCRCTGHRMPGEALFFSRNNATGVASQRGLEESCTSLISKHRSTTFGRDSTRLGATSAEFCPSLAKSGSIWPTPCSTGHLAPTRLTYSRFRPQSTWTRVRPRIRPCFANNRRRAASGRGRPQFDRIQGAAILCVIPPTPMNSRPHRDRMIKSQRSQQVTDPYSCGPQALTHVGAMRFWPPPKQTLGLPYPLPRHEPLLDHRKHAVHTSLNCASADTLGDHGATCIAVHGLSVFVRGPRPGAHGCFWKPLHSPWRPAPPHLRCATVQCSTKRRCGAQWGNHG